MEDDIFLNAEEDLKIAEFIKAYLPQEVKPRFTDDDIMYFMDSLGEYFEESGILDMEPDEDGSVEIDLDEVANALAEKARKEKYGEFSPEDLVWVVQGELEYTEEE